MLEKDIYRAAQALLDKHKGNSKFAMAEIAAKYVKFTRESNVEMRTLTIKIERALRDITKYDYSVEKLN